MPSTALGHTRPTASGDPGPAGRVLLGMAHLSTWSLRLLLVVAAALLVLWTLAQLWVIVLPLLLALLLSTVLWPSTRVLRRALPNALAAALVTLTALLVPTALLVVLVPRVVAQSTLLAEQVVAGLGEVQRRLTGPPFNLGPDRFGVTVEDLITQLQANIQRVALEVVNGISIIGGVLITVVLTVAITFFFLKDGTRFVPWLRELLGPSGGRHVEILARRSWTTVGTFIRTQAFVGMIDAVCIGTGLALLGVPLAFTLSVLIFFGAFVPIVGAFVTGALAALVALVSEGVSTAVAVVVIVLIVQQLEGNVLQPLLMGQVLRLHPVVVLLAVTAGAALSGIIGAFLAVPVVAVVAVAARYALEVAVNGSRGELAGKQPPDPSPEPQDARDDAKSPLGQPDSRARSASLSSSEPGPASGVRPRR